MAYGNPGKSMKQKPKPVKKPKRGRSKGGQMSAAVGQRKQYRMTGKAN